MRTKDREPWWKVSAGSKVTVKGTASAESRKAICHCVIVEADKNPADGDRPQLAKHMAKGRREGQVRR